MNINAMDIMSEIGEDFLLEIFFIVKRDKQIKYPGQTLPSEQWYALTLVVCTYK